MSDALVVCACPRCRLADRNLHSMAAVDRSPVLVPIALGAVALVAFPALFLTDLSITAVAIGASAPAVLILLVAWRIGSFSRRQLAKPDPLDPGRAGRFAIAHPAVVYLAGPLSAAAWSFAFFRQSWGWLGQLIALAVCTPYLVRRQRRLTQDCRRLQAD